MCIKSSTEKLATTNNTGSAGAIAVVIAAQSPANPLLYP